MQIINTKDVGKYIKEARKSQGLTQADLAAASNTGVRFIVDLEKGKETVQLGKVLSICSALGIGVNLTGGKDE